VQRKSTITESYFKEHFAAEEKLVDVAPYIRISAANVLACSIEATLRQM